jgi:hypothetical protein
MPFNVIQLLGSNNGLFQSWKVVLQSAPRTGSSVTFQYTCQQLVVLSWWDCLRTAPTNEHIVHPSGDIWVWNIDGMILTGENKKNYERNLSQRHFVRHKSHMDSTGRNPGLRAERRATNGLSHDTACAQLKFRHRQWLDSPTCVLAFLRTSCQLSSQQLLLYISWQESFPGWVCQT